MAGITTFLDESQMPNRSQEQKVFDNLVAYVFQNFPKWGREVNESLGAFNAALAGGAYALPYIFDSATADADPGAGKLRLSSATQNTATVLRLDLTAGGQDYTTLIDTIDGSTSVIKGSIRLTKQGDLSKWMTFDVSARAAPNGYRNLAVVCTGSSSASPFANGDALMLFFQRNGDRGQTGANGVLTLASATVTTTVANIDFLNIFNADCDRYTIELQGFSGTGFIAIQLAAMGAVITNTSYPYATSGNAINAGNSSFVINSGAGGSGVYTLDVRNVNSTTRPCAIGSRGVYGDGNQGYNSLMEGYCSAIGIKSGFRISGSPSFTSGTVRIFGHRNS